jgi:hypothetical protein
MPYPFDSVRSGPYNHGPNYYQCWSLDEPEHLPQYDYTVDLACAMWDGEKEAFFIRKKPEDAEISIDALPKHAKNKFTDPKTGSSLKEWKGLAIGIKIHRGADARALRQKYANRVLPTRYLEKWKDMGDEHDNGLGDDNYPKHLDAKSRWIIQGFHEPDIEKLQRSVPTPETSDVPLTHPDDCITAGSGFLRRRKGSIYSVRERSAKRTYFLQPTTWRYPRRGRPRSSD